jgi:5'-methylthioadenosine phosphorylase
MVVHVELADPFCPVLRRRLLDHVKAASTVVHDHGTYVCMEGPQFSTRAESNMHRAWGGTLVGMTVMPEAKLAREAELSYAHVALVTDYDCWRPQDGYDKQALLAEIIGNLKSGTHNAIAMIQATVASLAKDPIRESPAFDALNMALWTDTKAVPRRAVERLQPLIGRLFADKG